MKKIANYIRFLRMQKGLSQENMAQKLNITVPAYSKIERGLSNISFLRLNQIAACLEVTVTSLVDYYENGDDYLDPYLQLLDNNGGILEQEEDALSSMRSRIVVLEQNIKQLRHAIVFIKDASKKYNEEAHDHE